MHIIGPISLRKIGDEYIMVSSSDESLDYTQGVSLNETAAYLIELVGEREFTAEEWVAALLDRYQNVERAQAEADVQVLIEGLQQAKVLA